jgi:8-oxo-dGTP pyrophosphatase MutT (NUDIX family)
MDTLIEGSAVFIVHNKTLLLLLRDDIPTIANPCTFALLAGAFEKEEDNDCYDTIVREILEEIRLRVTRNRIRKIGTEKLLSENKFNHFFLLEISDEEKNRLELVEGQKMQFFSYDDIRWMAQLGKRKYGLGGAMWRFMSEDSEIIESIVLGGGDTFVIDRK